MIAERQGWRRLAAFTAVLLLALAPFIAALSNAAAARAGRGIPICTARGIVWVPGGNKAPAPDRRSGPHLCCLLHGCGGALEPDHTRSPQPVRFALPRRIPAGDEILPAGAPLASFRARAPPASRSLS